MSQRARALIARHASPVLSSFFCECVESVGCSLHCFEGFPTFTKTITSNFDSTWKTEYKNSSRANSKVKLWSFSFHLLCKFSFDVYAHPWVFFPLSPLPLRNLFSYSCSDHDLFKMAAASVKRFHTTILHVIFESPQRVTWDFHSY